MQMKGETQLPKLQRFWKRKSGHSGPWMPLNPKSDVYNILRDDSSYWGKQPVFERCPGWENCIPEAAQHLWVAGSWEEARHQEILVTTCLFLPQTPGKSCLWDFLYNIYCCTAGPLLGASSKPCQELLNAASPGKPPNLQIRERCSGEWPNMDCSQRDREWNVGQTTPINSLGRRLSEGKLYGCCVIWCVGKGVEITSGLAEVGKYWVLGQLYCNFPFPN